MTLPDDARELNRIGDDSRIVLNGHECWLVYERADGKDDRSLIFDRGGMVRRVRRYPANWRELPDIELFGLSWNR